MQAVWSPETGSSLSTLFARYIDGQINEQSWKKMMRTFDLEGITNFERLAFARFMNEVISEGSDAVNVPQPEEMEEILTTMRQIRN